LIIRSCSSIVAFIVKQAYMAFHQTIERHSNSVGRQTLVKEYAAYNVGVTKTKIACLSGGSELNLCSQKVGTL
jgi:hypothetical protein